MSRACLIRPIAFVIALVAVIVVMQMTGITDYLSLDNLARLQDYVESFGPAAPLVFVVGYAVATVAFLTDTPPLALLAGLAFGSVLGAVYAVAGAMTGLTLAFLVTLRRERTGSFLDRGEQTGETPG